MSNHEQLQRAPSRESLARLAEEIAPGSSIGNVRRLRGGISNGMHAVTLRPPTGPRVGVVVRRYVDWGEEDTSELARKEWLVLRHLEAVGTPAPRPLLSDADGEIFGCPAIVTSLLRGRPLRAPDDPSAWAEELARALAAIHAVPFEPLRDHLRLISGPDFPARDRRGEEAPPRVARHPDGSRVWDEIQRERERLTPVPPVFLHTDFWPGNTVWRGGRLIGVVDWDWPGIGEPGSDVAYARMDMFVVGIPGAADLFQAAYEEATGRPLENMRYWELVAATNPMPDPSVWITGWKDTGFDGPSVRSVRANLRAYIRRLMDS